ncbi:CRISPR locus-related DNA-binding protein [Ignisphaera aggregans DSM 17230]|uniref:CRISPR locus-related DNA-binding protein n=1 Tax=Ignisphaera aggregans (strain DSM 17230 / JCM 13409 / AQ1.S1) TaxID=583356 RepID=E0STW2_IGNAA|nr:CRISPR locus-related DNA-binding protein [Ignisphaera aggregans DSM 17230]
MRKVVVVSVGISWERVARAIGRTGIGEGDVVLLFNSIPRVSDAEDAMNRLDLWLREVYREVVVEMFWLDPRNGFEENVALIRRNVERFAPCKAYFLAVGGFRWLSMAVAYAAFATHTLSHITNVSVETLELELEEDTKTRDIIRQIFPTQESRVIRIPILLKLAEIDYTELQILKEIATGTKRTKHLVKKLGIPRQTLQRKLVKLVKKELLEYEKKGKSYEYIPTDLAKMLL